LTEEHSVFSHIL